MDRIVLLGGTFNPLSKAHDRILRFAKSKTDAREAILLPAPDTFMNSWKGFEESDILPLKTRLKILDKYCQRHKDTLLETIEVDGKTHSTYESLNYLKEKYETKIIYFVLGTEKISELNRWHESDRLLSENRFLMMRRHNDDMKAILANPLVIQYRQNFRFLDAGEDIQEISSTRIREALRHKDMKTIKALTFSYVVDILKEDNIL